MIVAIDGPAGAGKSSVARAVAKRLGFDYLDTGAMYRAIALAVLEAGVDPMAQDDVERLAARADVGVDADAVWLDGRDVTRRIREPEVTSAVTAVSVYPEVRKEMALRQRLAAAGGNVVIEGRDIGTEVAPDAEVKVFLTASLAERARRRLRQLGMGEDEASVREMADSLAARDDTDSTRAISPLRRAPDAYELDSTRLTLDEVVDEIIERVDALRS